MIIRRTVVICGLLLAGCVGTRWQMPNEFVYMVEKTEKYDVATYQKISDTKSPVRIYIEGDGHAFNSYGHPTSDPTPRGTMLREMAARDTAPNVVYMARPCQYIKSATCTRTDWTTGRFSSDIVESVAGIIKRVAGDRPIVLIGYSGGAMLTALIIANNPQLNVLQWITIAGVLNHDEWTEYFGDTPLKHSMHLNTLPRIPGCHYVASYDKNVPNELSRRWIGDGTIITVPNSTHNDFGDLVPDCTNVAK